jgi:hypothetical protein
VLVAGKGPVEDRIAPPFAQSFAAGKGRPREEREGNGGRNRDEDEGEGAGTRSALRSAGGRFCFGLLRHHEIWPDCGPFLAFSFFSFDA